MKLLLDENLSQRMLPALRARWPGSAQVTSTGLGGATDAQLCAYASEHGFIVCSKDDDFRRFVSERGYRPKLILLAMGNATNDEILATLLASADAIDTAFSDPATGIVVLG